MLTVLCTVYIVLYQIEKLKEFIKYRDFLCVSSMKLLLKYYTILRIVSYILFFSYLFSVYVYHFLCVRMSSSLKTL